MSEMDLHDVDANGYAESAELSDDVEAPEADVVEQHQTLRDDDEQQASVHGGGYPVEADAADAAEQDRIVPLDDEDDYR